MKKSIGNLKPADAHKVADELKKLIGINIQNKRRKLDKTVEFVANKLHISRVALTHIENGRNHINGVMLWELACLFGCEVSDLFPQITDKFKLTKADLSSIGDIDPKAAEWAEKVANKLLN